MNNSLIENVPVREQVSTWLIAELEQATAGEREYLIRLLVSRLSRQTLDGLFIAFAWRHRNDGTATDTQSSHTLTDFLHKEHPTTESEA